jgi:hypothetical protein
MYMPTVVPGYLFDVFGKQRLAWMDEWLGSFTITGLRTTFKAFGKRERHTRPLALPILDHGSSAHWRRAGGPPAEALLQNHNDRHGICHLEVRISQAPSLIWTPADTCGHSTWISLAGSIGLVMPSGGSVSFVYGFIFCTVCNICLSASVGELASVWPTAGGQYHYTYALCTKKWRGSIVC